MQRNVKLTTKEVALTICFAALYAVLSFLPLNQVIGLVGKAITAATIIAPIVGILLGSYLGMLSTGLGGIIAMYSNPIFPPASLAAGIIAALCAGLLYARKRILCALIYVSLMFLFGFYPVVGPVWLYPSFIWFQIVGFLILISPLQSIASKNFNSESSLKLLFVFLVTSLTSTLAGQIAGSLTFELVYSSFFDVETWASNWQLLTWVYPIERTIITLIATFIGVFLYKVLMSANLMPFSGRTKQS